MRVNPSGMAPDDVILYKPLKIELEISKFGGFARRRHATSRYPHDETAVVGCKIP